MYPFPSTSYCAQICLTALLVFVSIRIGLKSCDVYRIKFLLAASFIIYATLTSCSLTVLVGTFTLKNLLNSGRNSFYVTDPPPSLSNSRNNAWCSDLDIVVLAKLISCSNASMKSVISKVSSTALQSVSNYLNIFFPNRKSSSSQSCLTFSTPQVSLCSSCPQLT